MRRSPLTTACTTPPNRRGELDVGLLLVDKESVACLHLVALANDNLRSHAYKVVRYKGVLGSSLNGELLLAAFSLQVDVQTLT